MIRITLKKLAALCHVSVATVSKAFSGSREISSETRNRIFEAAKENGCYDKYCKMVYPKKVIAVICPEIQSEHYYSMVTYLEQLINNAGATMVLSLNHFSKQVSESLFSYHAYYQKADGIIMISSPAGLVNSNNIPAVFISSSVNSCLGCDIIHINIENGIREAVMYLKQNGHRRIGFIGEGLTESTQRKFLKISGDCGLSVNNEFIATSTQRFEQGGYECMEHIIKSGQHPTAIIAAYDYMAVGAIKCAQANGLRVPEDVSFIGMDDITIDSYMPVPITSIATHTKEICETAAELIFRKIENPYYTSGHEINFNCELVKRESVMDIRRQQ